MKSSYKTYKDGQLIDNEYVNNPNRVYGLTDQINTYDDYIAMRLEYGFTVHCSYESWINEQKQEDKRFLKEFPREFKWTGERLSDNN